MKLHFVGGNHDIWAADYFRDRYGCEIAPVDRVIQLGDLRIRLCHGDRPAGVRLGLQHLPWTSYAPARASCWPNRCTPNCSTTLSAPG